MLCELKINENQLCVDVDCCQINETARNPFRGLLMMPLNTCFYSILVKKKNFSLGNAL